jgi:LysR family transcriptional regulator, low CO2-responsive transcriptional regulator
VVLDVAELPIMRHWYVVHRRGKRLSSAAQAFKAFLLREARPLLQAADSDGARGTGIKRHVRK